MRIRTRRRRRGGRQGARGEEGRGCAQGVFVRDATANPTGIVSRGLRFSPSLSWPRFIAGYVRPGRRGGRVARQQQVEEAREGGLRVALPSQSSFSIPFSTATASVSFSTSCFLASRSERGLKSLYATRGGTPISRKSENSATTTAMSATRVPMRRECGEVVTHTHTPHTR